MTDQNHSEETGYVDGHLEPTVEFPYGEIDRGNPLAAELERPVRELLLELTGKFRRVVMHIESDSNSKKSALCFLIATGDPGAEGVKIASAAKKFGVSKQDISKCCVDWCKLLSIEPSSYMRSQTSKESFRKSNTRRKKS
jgi:hypothetical protein